MAPAVVINGGAYAPIPTGFQARSLIRSDERELIFKKQMIKAEPCDEKCHEAGTGVNACSFEEAKDKQANQSDAQQIGPLIRTYNITPYGPSTLLVCTNPWRINISR